MIKLNGEQLDFLFSICRDCCDGEFKFLNLLTFTEKLEDDKYYTRLPQIFLDNVPNMKFKFTSKIPRTDSDYFEFKITIRLNGIDTSIATMSCLTEGFENYKYSNITRIII